MVVSLLVTATPALCEEPTEPVPPQPQDRTEEQTQTAMDINPEGIMYQTQECYKATQI